MTFCNITLFSQIFPCLNARKIECSYLQWKTWPALFGMSTKSHAGVYILSYIMYVVWGLMFAFLAAMLVRLFAPYACSSGLPEVGVEHLFIDDSCSLLLGR